MKKNKKVLIISFILIYIGVFSFVDIVKGEVYTDIAGENITVPQGGGVTIINYSRDLIIPMVKITMVSSNGIKHGSKLYRLIGNTNKGIQNEFISSATNPYNSTTTRCDEVTDPSDETSGCNMTKGDNFVKKLKEDLENNTDGIAYNISRELCNGCSYNDSYFIIEPVFIWGLKKREGTNVQIRYGTSREMYYNIFFNPNPTINEIIYGVTETTAGAREVYLEMLLATMRPETSGYATIYKKYYDNNNLIFKAPTSGEPTFGTDGKCNGNNCLNYALGFGIFKVSEFLDETCETDFDSANKDGIITMEERVSIYLKYKSKEMSSPLYGNFTNLLSNEMDAALACKSATCSSTTGNIDCLSASYIDNNFGENNLACSNMSTKESPSNSNKNIVAFCSNYFNVNKVSSIAANSFNVNSGRLLFRNLGEGVFATGELGKTCYMFIGPKQDIKYDSYSKYTGNEWKISLTSSTLSFNIKDENSKLDNISINYSSEDPVNSSSGNKFTVTKNLKLSFLPVYSKIISGVNKKLSEYNDVPSSEKNLYRKIGYGPYVYLDAHKMSSGAFYLNYKLIVSGTEIATNPTVTKCEYLVKPKIIIPGESDEPDELNLQFRIIDVNNPFPGKDGTSRNVGSNWRVNYSGDIEPGLVDLLKLYQDINNGVADISYDSTGDGAVNIADLFVLYSSASGSCNLIVGEDSSSDNCLVKSVMDYTNNSYNKNGDSEPLYSIKLTSNTIKKIRAYNSSNSYDDYTLECDSNGYNCESRFLKDLSQGYITSYDSNGNIILRKQINNKLIIRTS